MELDRHGHNRRDAVRAGGLDEVARVPAAQHHDLGADQDRRLKPDQEADGVIERSDGGDDVVAGKLVLDRDRVGRDVTRPMADQRALGQAGSAAGKRHRERISVGQRNVRRLRRLTIEKFVQPDGVEAVGLADHHDLFELRKLVEHRRDRCLRLLLHDQDLHLCFRQDVGQLFRSEHDREVDQQAAGPGVAEMDDRVFRNVRAHHRDAVALAQTEPQNGMGELVRTALELAIGQTLIAIDQCRFGRMFLGGKSENIARKHAGHSLI